MVLFANVSKFGIIRIRFIMNPIGQDFLVFSVSKWFWWVEKSKQRLHNIQKQIDKSAHDDIGHWANLPNWYISFFDSEKCMFLAEKLPERAKRSRSGPVDYAALAKGK